MLRTASVAVQAARADLLRRRVLKCKNLCLVSSSVDVSLPGTVATFTTLPLRAFIRFQRSYKVRRILKVFEESFCRHVRVTGFAGLGADVKGRIRRARVALLILFCICVMLPRRTAKGDYRSREKKQKAGKKNDPWLLPMSVVHHHPIPIHTPLSAGLSKAKAR